MDGRIHGRRCVDAVRACGSWELLTPEQALCLVETFRAHGVRNVRRILNRCAEEGALTAERIYADRGRASPVGYRRKGPANGKGSRPRIAGAFATPVDLQRAVLRNDLVSLATCEGFEVVARLGPSTTHVARADYGVLIIVDDPRLSLESQIQHASNMPSGFQAVVRDLGTAYDPETQRAALSPRVSAWHDVIIRRWGGHALSTDILTGAWFAGVDGALGLSSRLLKKRLESNPFSAVVQPRSCVDYTGPDREDRLRLFLDRR